MYPIPIITNGHGGIINGIYQTQGKRSPVWSGGSQLFEGEFNRAIVARVIEMLTMQQTPYFQLTPEATDIHRLKRVKRANKFNAENGGNTFLLDIHSNASPRRIRGKGRGSEVHIAVNASDKSKELSKIARDQYKLLFPEERYRGTKRKNWTIVHKTAMPAMLLECFFMDNERECKKYLMTREGRDQIALWVVEIIHIYQCTEKYIKQ